MSTVLLSQASAPYAIFFLQKEAASHVTRPASPVLAAVPQIVFTVNSLSTYTIHSVFKNVQQDFLEVGADACPALMVVSPVPPTLHATSAPQPSISTTTNALLHVPQDSSVIEECALPVKETVKHAMDLDKTSVPHVLMAHFY